MASKLLLASLCIACILSCSYADLINDVCARARSTASCAKVLRTNPNAIKARDLPSLGLAAINTAHGFTNSSKSIATKLLVKSNNDAGLKLCIENFCDAIEDLNECRGLLTKKDKASLNIKASSAYTNVDTCIEEYSPPEHLKNEIYNVIEACSALLALSNML